MPLLNDVETALVRVKRQFGDEYGVVISDADVFGWMYEAELDIIRSTGCNENTSQIMASSFPLDLPDTIKFKRLSISGKALQYTTVAELDLLALSTTTTGNVQYWYNQNNKVYIWPDESTNRMIDVTYSKTPVLMESPVPAEFTVPRVYTEDIINYCIGRAHNKNNNLQAEQVQMGLYDKNLNVRRDESQSIDAAIYKGGDPMDFEDEWL